MEINKSLKNNTIYNITKIILLTIFPLITFPYASRILGVENIGKVQFANTFISFFSLFACLSINVYGLREGAPLRDNRKKISSFASELFSINVITVILSFFILFISLFTIPQLNAVALLILIYSIQMAFLTIGFEWIYTIFEDYVFILIQSVVVQFIALFLVFFFVKNQNDYLIYALIIVLAQSIIYLFNFIRVRHYIDLKFTIHNHFRKHIKPMFLLFSSELSQRIYITSDVILLGLFASNYYIGIYTVTTKIYNIIKKLLSSICNVTLARLNYYHAKNKKAFIDLYEKMFNITFFIMLPIIVLLFLLSSNIILIISGNDYLEGSITLKLLCFSLLFSVIANLYSNGILIVYKQEKYVLYGTILAAVTNIILNLIIIPFYKQNGAAITTIISEFIMTIYSYCKAKKYIQSNNSIANLFKEFVGCIGIIIVYIFLSSMKLDNNIFFLFINGFACLFIYFLVEILLKNQVLITTLKEYYEKIHILFKGEK